MDAVEIVVPIVAIGCWFLYSLAKLILRPASGSNGKPADAEATHNQRELLDLAVRLQNRVETLERLLDSSQPEWRGKS